MSKSDLASSVKDLSLKIDNLSGLSATFKEFEDKFDTFAKDIKSLCLELSSRLDTQQSMLDHQQANLEKVTSISHVHDFSDSFDDLNHKVSKTSADILAIQNNTTKSLLDFRTELSEFQLSGNPSISSALVQLSSAIKNSTSVQENALNKPLYVADPSCPTFIFAFVAHLRYKIKSGVLTFFEVLQRSPTILSIFYSKIRLLQPTFEFKDTNSDFTVFKEIMDSVFYPHGFTTEGFQQVVNAHPLKSPFTLQSAYEYAIFIKDILTALAPILPQSENQISQFWNVVASGVDPTIPFQYHLLTQHPKTYEQFYNTMDRKIISFFDSNSSTGYSPSQSSPHRAPYPYAGGSSPTQSSPHRTPYPYAGGSSPNPPSKPRPVNSVAVLPSCDNCNAVGHNSFNCLREFCRPCHDSDGDFFHRPKDCVLHDFHE